MNHRVTCSVGIKSSPNISGQPDGGWLLQVNAAKRAGHYAENCHIDAPQQHLRADHGGVTAEVLPPQAVADDYTRGFVASARLLLGKHAAEPRVHAECGEVVRGDDVDRNSEGVVGDVQQATAMLVSNHTVERRSLTAQIQVIRLPGRTARVIAGAIVLACEYAD